MDKPRPVTDRETYFTTHQVAKLLGVSLPTVSNWVKAGMLRAHRTPGGHRRIGQGPLMVFCRDRGLPIPRELLGEDQRVRVLVVDDEPDFTELVSAALAMHQTDFEVEVAGSGFAAGLAVARFQPHVILLDLMMPDVDGFEVFRLLSQQQETQDIPVIACTAFSDPYVEQRARRLGFSDFLPKPVDLTVLPGVLFNVVGIAS